MLKCQIEKKIGPVMIDCNLEVQKNRLLCVLGPSGCGKTSLLNLLAGFKEPEQGEISLDGVVLYDEKNAINQSINKRGIGYIQQEAYLFPHLSVKENMLYSIPKKDRTKYEQRYRQFIDMFNLKGHENERPGVLSGGQKQRVAIGRALMMSPKLLLWDEPFSALDHKIRKEMQDLVLAVKKSLGIPMIFVTHDLEEAFVLADDLAVMEDGKILQYGEKDHVLKAPVSGKVKGLIGKNTKKSPFILGVSGYSNSGKTRLMEHLISGLKKAGYKVGTIKHHAGDFEIDTPGKDSYKHRKAGSDRVILASNDKCVSIRERSIRDSNDTIQLSDLIEEQSDMDVILFEGYKRSPYRKIEVVGQEQGQELACDPKTLVGIVCDQYLNVKPNSLPQFKTDAYDKILDFVIRQVKEHECER